MPFKNSFGCFCEMILNCGGIPQKIPGINSVREFKFPPPNRRPPTVPTKRTVPSVPASY